MAAHALVTLQKNISNAELLRMRAMRWKGRTDLRWLCKNVLGFQDAHSPHLDPLYKFVQHFPKPPDNLLNQLDIVEPGKPLRYTPYIPLYDIDGGPAVNGGQGCRRRLLIDSRGTMKTHIAVLAHFVQVFLNYPDIACAVFRADLSGAQDLLYGVKSQFQFNERLRSLYPDYCPQKRIGDWGNRDEFVLPNRVNKMRIEPSLRCLSIDQGVAGQHFDWMKFDDIVDESNTKTEGQIVKVCNDFANRENLLVKPAGWMDVSGTRYSYSDIYGKIVETWEKDEDYRQHWRVFLRGCYVQDCEPHTFEPRKYAADGKTIISEGELERPYKLDAEGKKISWWPERFPTKLLETQQKENPQQFANQRLNNPQEDAEIAPFPMQYFQTKSRMEFVRIPIAYHSVTVDTASTANATSDYSCVTVCGWDGAGRCYVHDIRHGRMTAEVLINHIFDVTVKYRARSVKIESDAYVRGLMPSILRRSDLTGVYLPIESIQRETNVSKHNRILMTLQPWYKRKEIIFLDDLECLDHLKKELQRMSPHGAKFTDDILDTLADQFQNREWFGREQDRAESALQDETKRLMEDYAAKAKLKALAEAEMQRLFDFDQQDMVGGVDEWRSIVGGI